MFLFPMSVCKGKHNIPETLDSGIIDFRNLRLPDPSGSRGGGGGGGGPGNMYFFFILCIYIQ